MKTLYKTGLFLFLTGFLVFNFIVFKGSFYLTPCDLEFVLNQQEKDNLLGELLVVTNKKYNNAFTISNDIINIYNTKNDLLKKQNQWEKVMWGSAHDFSYKLLKVSAKKYSFTFRFSLLILSIATCGAGALLIILASSKRTSSHEINNNIFRQASTSRGWIAILLSLWLIAFYIVLYWMPSYIVNWVILVDPISKVISGNEASPWFLYGFLYCLAMITMAIRMYIKYRNNRYQIIRTSSVLFFQLAFAFLIPEILVRFNMPYMDFKNIWPLDYDFFFEWNINTLIGSGKIGIFMLAWGIVLIIVAVPFFTYYFGKRWYCSWVCGCGGLAETLGDPFRQLSDKSLKAWKIERLIIYPIFIFALLMTAVTLYTFFSNQTEILGVNTYDIQKVYGFLIGSLFAGVIGTGFYPLMGNRVWCRFGCPLAAYMGIIQRYKSKFRITTNGSQCISCGNCSTYCEMGIDVRWYAQKGQNIIRASCVGCGICAAVCPRGVLKLENADEKNRFAQYP